MKAFDRKISATRSLSASALVLAGSLTSHAQSCALCYTQAAAEKQRFIDGLRSGIIALVLPSFFVCSVMMMLAYRKRSVFVDDDTLDHDLW